MSSPQDAEVILRLYELRREPVLRQARDWFAQSFTAGSYAEFERDCPRGGDANRYFRMVTSYWDMASAIVLRGAVDEALFFDTCGEMMYVWRKVGPWLGELRQARGLPGYLRNLEHLAGRFQRHLEGQGS